MKHTYSNSTASRGTGKTLVLYEERVFYIGDNCIKLDKIGLCKTFFNSQVLDINFRSAYFPAYKAILEQHPYFDGVMALPYDEIEFSSYDQIVVISYEEERLLLYLQNRYADLFEKNEFYTKIYSASRYIIDPENDEDIVFPQNQEMSDYVLVEHKNKPTELLITDEERSWANNWLRENGLRENDRLIVMLDSTSRRDKLVKIDTYFTILEHLMADNTKVLVFDEKSAKEPFYRAYLNDDALFDKMIFSKGQTLRRDLSLLASDYIELILGPCTGLMHCASGIFNCDVARGKPLDKVPLIVTYTGKYFTKTNFRANDWWGTSPLVNCLILQETDGQKEMKLLKHCTEEEKNNNDNKLVCEEYTAEMIIGFIENEMAARGKAVGRLAF